jgi:hypothetical protein
MLHHQSFAYSLLSALLLPSSSVSPVRSGGVKLGGNIVVGPLSCSSEPIFSLKSSLYGPMEFKFDSTVPLPSSDLTMISSGSFDICSISNETSSVIFLGTLSAKKTRLKTTVNGVFPYFMTESDPKLMPCSGKRVTGYTSFTVLTDVVAQTWLNECPLISFS